jgi:Holliday junction resolvasome RuvABC ATP-dependent DNA helicase subunit
VVASFRTDDQGKDGVNYTSVYRKVNTFLQKKYKKVFCFIMRTPRGRSATNLAYEHLGLKNPDAPASSLFDE